MEHIIKEIEELKKLVSAQSTAQKEVLTFKEGAQFLNLSTSQLYKLTSTGSIPMYKPLGKIIYFKRTELEEWMLRGKVESIEERIRKVSSKK